MRMVGTGMGNRSRALRRVGGVLGALAVAAAIVIGGAGIAHSQTDAVTIFGCVDSRVPPELVFDEGLGDLFVVRSAGHVLDDAELGSLEFGLEELHIPLVVVLAHTRCGAISAATDVASGKLHAPDRIESLTTAIRPAVDDARKQLGQSATDAALRDLAGKLHLERTVARLRESPMFAEAIEAKKLRVVGGRYVLDSGRVELLVS